MDISFIIFYVSVSICLTTVDAGKQDKLGTVKIKREYSKNGFHRDVITNIEWTLPSPSLVPIGSCRIMLIETIPKGMFVDLDEIDAAVPFGGLQVISSQPFDVEKPAHFSERNDILVYPQCSVDERKMKLFVNSTLPVHLRYHQPMENVVSNYVYLKQPVVVGYCKDLAVADGNIIVSAPCGPNEARLCPWKRIDSKHQTEKEMLMFHVPVGDLKHTLVVTTGTILVTAAGAALILRFIIFSREIT